MRLAVFTKNWSNPAYGAARLGAERAAAPYGAEVTHYVPETPDHPGQQGALIDQALAQDPDAFVLSPVHATEVDPALRRIAVAGKPIVSFVNPVNAVASVAYVGADDVRLAAGIAKYLFEHLGGQGRVLVVSGPVDSVTSVDRLRGFAEAARAFPGIRLLGPVAGDYQRAPARERGESWLRQHGAVDGVLAANDIMAVGVLESLDALGQAAAVVGVNAIPEAVKAIGAGRMLATADFNAMQMAAVATECAIRHLRGEPVPRQLELAVDIVDGSNWQGWDLPYEQRALRTLEQLWRQAR
jgi:ribose transport system substrate-binding protein